jgi:hypothetical protein
VYARIATFDRALCDNLYTDDDDDDDDDDT